MTNLVLQYSQTICKFVYTLKSAKLPIFNSSVLCVELRWIKILPYFSKITAMYLCVFFIGLAIYIYICYLIFSSFLCTHCTGDPAPNHAWFTGHKSCSYNLHVYQGQRRKEDYLWNILLTTHSNFLVKKLVHYLVLYQSCKKVKFDFFF